MPIQPKTWFSNRNSKIFNKIPTILHSVLHILVIDLITETKQGKVLHSVIECELINDKTDSQMKKKILEEDHLLEAMHGNNVRQEEKRY